MKLEVNRIHEHGKFIYTSSVGIKTCRSKMCVSEVKTDETRDGFKRVTRGKTGEKSGRSGVRQQRVRIVVLICSKLCWHTLFCQTHIKHMYFYIASVLCVCCGCNGELWRRWLILKPKSRYCFNFSFYWYRYTSWIFFPVLNTFHI